MAVSHAMFELFKRENEMTTIEKSFDASKMHGFNRAKCRGHSLAQGDETVRAWRGPGNTRCVAIRLDKIWMLVVGPRPLCGRCWTHMRDLRNVVRLASADIDAAKGGEA